MLNDSFDRESIGAFVRAFYARAVRDGEIGPYFVEALGNNLEDESWQTHFRVLEDFWLMMLTGERVYSRNPFYPHRFIGRLTYDSFDRWLALTKEVLEQNFSPELVEIFYKKAKTIAGNFIKMLEQYNEIYDY